MSDARQVAFVSPDFAPPMGLRTKEFVLLPIGPQHNEADYAAWTSSIQHIRSTPGFADNPWPNEDVSSEQNLRDLAQHATDFSKRLGFTYTVLDSMESEVIGCVYIYPSTDPAYDATVRSWVTARHSALDLPLRRSVAAWLACHWPFRAVDYFVSGSA